MGVSNFCTGPTVSYCSAGSEVFFAKLTLMARFSNRTWTKLPSKAKDLTH